MLATVGVAEAQDATSLPLRGIGETGPATGSPAGTGLGMGTGLGTSTGTSTGTGTGLSPISVAPPRAPGSDPGYQSSAGRRPVRRPTTRRSRGPASAQVQLQTRPTLGLPDSLATIQPQLNGVPDPPLLVPVIGPRKPTIKRDEDSYAQLGIRSGGMTYLPAIGESIGYDTNPNRTQSLRRGSFVSQTEAELGLQSDWSRHELKGQLRGAYDVYTDNPEANRPEGAGQIGLKLDVTRDSFVQIDGRFLIDTQRPDSPDLNAAVRTRPVIATEGASLGFTQRFNRLIGTIQGTVDRADYEDARLSSGATLDQGDRNLTQYGLRGRLGYELTPGLIPFVEIVGDTREYDRRVDDSGFRRSSDGIGGRVGTTFEITRLLTGEIAVGAIRRSYEDPRLADLTSPLLNAALTWAVTPLTTVRATAQATVDETTVLNSNGVRTVRGTLEVSHALRRNVTLTAGLTASDAEYNGVSISEQGFGALARVDYKLTRWLGIRASYNYERLHSTFAGSSYTANVFLLGMRFTP